MKFDDSLLYKINTSLLGTRFSIYDLATWKNGLAFKKANFSSEGVPIIKIAELNNGIGSTTAYTKDKFAEDVHIKKGDLLFSWSGNPYTSIDIFRFDMEEGWLNQHIFKVMPNINIVDFDYFYFLMKYIKPYLVEIAVNKQTTGLGHITISDLKRMSITIPPIDIQTKIVKILKPIDEKIFYNKRINQNLQQQVSTLYKQIFVLSETEYTECRADEYFDITIGKTPPRKEQEWFTKNNSDVRWISISDMGSCGTYISNSSEYLTQKAVDKFNVVQVPDNTVILSFKLTVGRVAITNGLSTTNEAIAHFKTNKPNINPYLYCYLKDFSFASLGSTSSIATAVNSKIVKGMPFIIPTDDDLNNFNKMAIPMFEAIKANQTEISYLTALRDALLPKLMSGEIDVSNIEI